MILLDIFVAHLVGDFLLQTEAQARLKFTVWQARAMHVSTYCIPFVIVAYLHAHSMALGGVVSGAAVAESLHHRYAALVDGRAGVAADCTGPDAARGGAGDTGEVFVMAADFRCLRENEEDTTQVCILREGHTGDHRYVRESDIGVVYYAGAPIMQEIDAEANVAERVSRGAL